MSELSIEQRARYLRGLLQRYGTLSLPLGSGLSFSLIQVFQPLRLRQSTTDESLHPAHTHDNAQQDEQESVEQQNETEEPAEPLYVFAENGIEALNKSPQGRLVILGGPGSGKTTVLKHLLCHHVHMALEESAAPLPIVLSLPDLARADQDLDTYLAFMARAMGLDANEGQAFSHAIQHGHAFICLDSLDEVLPRLRPGIIHQINALAQESGNTWIIGSRFTDYKGGQFQTGRFQEWELQPLDEARRLQLAEQLLPELHRQLPALTTPAPALSPHQYVQALSTHQQAASWGQNPLLFSLGAVAYLRRGTLSGSRAMLYREVIAALLETREPDDEQRTHVRTLLAEMALDLYQVKGRTFSVDEVRATLTHLNSEQRATWAVEETLYRVLNAGLLDVVTPDTYSFRHQTFQEYLVASALARHFMSEDEHTREAAQQLAWSKHTYSRWQEIERLIVGILVQEYGPAGRQQAIVWFMHLLRQQSSPEGDPGHLSLELAIRILGEVAELAEWQTEETRALEEEAATIWVKLVTTPSTIRSIGSKSPHRLGTLAPEIGRLRASAQEKTIKPLFQSLRQPSSYLSAPNPGALRSQVVADHLRSLYEVQPSHGSWLNSVFVHLQEYAPVDVLLTRLETEQLDKLQRTMHTLKHLGQYAPIPSLLALLNHGRAETRAAAATILLDVIGKADVPGEPLQEICQQRTIGAFEAARVLARFRHPAALEPLLAGLDQADKRKEALQALADLGPLAPKERLIACLEDTNPDIRQWAIRGLGNLGRAAPLERLLIMRTDTHETVRKTAIEVLGSLDRQGLSVPLSSFLEALYDPLNEVIVAAIKALGDMGQRAPLEELLPLLHHPSGWVVSSVLKVLGKPTIAERVPIEALLTFYTSHWTYRQQTLEALESMARRIPRDFLANALNDGDMATQQRAARILGQAAQHVPIELLLEDLGDKAWTVRNAAVVILGLDGAERALPSLLAALCDEVPRVSQTAALELRKIADLIPLSALLDVLHHPSPWVRRAALTVIAQRSTHFQPEPIIACLHDQDAFVRAAAAKIFLTWTEDAPLEELVNATRDEHEGVCLAAVSVLSKIGLRNPALAQESVLRVLMRPFFEDDEAEDTIGSALAAISPHAPSEPLMQAIETLYRQQRPWVTSQVARALARQGERIPVAILRQALQNPDVDVRESALLALSGAGAAAPIDEIVAQLREPGTVRNAAIEALCSLYAYVPERIFLQIWAEEVQTKQYSYYAKDILKAIKNKGSHIPVEMLSQTLHWPNFFSRDMVEFLVSLEELQFLPASTLLPMLALMRAVYQSTNLPPSLEAWYVTWMPRFALDTIREALQSPQAKVRLGILQLCAYRMEEIPQELLLAALNDSDQQVRVAAIKRLHAHSAPLPLQLLLKHLHSDYSNYADVRKAIIAVLGTLGSAAPIDDLLAMRQSAHATIRAATLTALRQPGLLERVPTEVFLSATGDADLVVRNAALQALKEKDQALAVTCCLAALGNSMPHTYLTKTYQVAFEMVRDVQPELLPAIRQEAMAVLAGGKADCFFRSLSRSFLADTIGNMGHATPELMARLSEMLDWPYWEVRMKAVQALGKLRRNIPDVTIRRLLELRHDPHSRAVREITEEALAEILSLEAGIEDD